MTDRYPGYDVLSKRWTRILERDDASGDRPASCRAARAPLLLADRMEHSQRGVRPHHAATERPPAGTVGGVCRSENRRSIAGRLSLRTIAAAGRGLATRLGGARAVGKRGARLRVSRSVLRTHKTRFCDACNKATWWALPGAECRCKLFFDHRVIPDITHAYYAHPTAWNEIGFGGPASPRGYVRMGLDRSDPWEAAEAKPGEDNRQTKRKNDRVG